MILTKIYDYILKIIGVLLPQYLKLVMGRISGRIMDIIKRDVRYCRIFSLSLLKSSDQFSFFYIKQHWYYPAGYLAKSDIQPNPTQQSCYQQLYYLF